MPHRSDRAHPRDYIVEGDTWPTGKLRADADPSAAAAQELANRLNNALTKQPKSSRSARHLAAAAGLSPATLSKIRNGKCWCDIDTLARLEHTLNTRLWGNKHRQQTNTP